MNQAWLVEARKHIGLKEIKGPLTNATIGTWLTRLKAWWKDDETPWCGTFVAHCLTTAGHPIPKHWYRALEWANYGFKLKAPVVGCIAVFTRTGGGHVGFVVGQSATGDYLILGGNQGDAVSIQTFPRSRNPVFVYPANAPYPDVLAALPIASAPKITTEA